MIQAGDDLVVLLLQALVNARIELQDGDILVLAQKIVSKAEGRKIALAGVHPSPAALALAQETEKDPRLVELILQESAKVLRSRPGLIVVEHKLGFVCANAGIDHSNIEDGADHVLLLPADPDASAGSLRAGISAASGAHLGVSIIDSHGRAWRRGTVGVTIGLAGLPGVIDYRGEIDLFGQELRVTEIGAVDELAAAASLMMGQADEAIPAVHVRGYPYTGSDQELGDLLRDPERDLFR
jgi:coenzyme F420-0:L-glutamate ligase/coenzyme F420-1:gamma-L-glutamate ligase